jgi:hypothetical protein
MSDTVSADGGGAAGRRPPGLVFVMLAFVVATLGLAPWLLAAMFAPALLGAPGPAPSPMTILGIAAVLSYPLWFLYWASRVRAERRAGAPGQFEALIMVSPAILLIAVFLFFNFGP